MGGPADTLALQRRPADSADHASRCVAAETRCDCVRQGGPSPGVLAWLKQRHVGCTPPHDLVSSEWEPLWGLTINHNF